MTLRELPYRGRRCEHPPRGRHGSTCSTDEYFFDSLEFEVVSASGNEGQARSASELKLVHSLALFEVALICWGSVTKMRHVSAKKRKKCSLACASGLYCYADTCSKYKPEAQASEPDSTHFAYNYVL
jgi:hypothetical protein